MTLVKHAVYKASELQGQRVAICEAPGFRAATLQVGNVLEDGLHELSVHWLEFVNYPNEHYTVASVKKNWRIEQKYMHKIFVPEPASYLAARDFAYAIVLDEGSSNLVKAGSNHA